jgi:SAM-dependent methyltransferase
VGPFSDAWDRGDAYEQYVGRWSRLVAPRFVSWLGIPAGRRWLDLGCGTGALSAAILDVAAPSAVFGVDPSEGFLETARTRLGGGAEFRRGTAAEIPLADASVDVAVSGLALNFVPPPRSPATQGPDRAGRIHLADGASVGRAGERGRHHRLPSR